jgi:hypothetical protein
LAGLYTYTISGGGVCPDATATVAVTINQLPNAGNNNSLTLCATDPSTNLFGSLLGVPQNIGVWTGPSVLTGGHLGSFNPNTGITGLYTYTVTGLAPCPSATANINVTVNSNANVSSIFHD